MTWLCSWVGQEHVETLKKSLPGNAMETYTQNNRPLLHTQQGALDNVGVNDAGYDEAHACLSLEVSSDKKKPRAAKGPYAGLGWKIFHHDPSDERRRPDPSGFRKIVSYLE